MGYCGLEECGGLEGVTVAECVDSVFPLLPSSKNGPPESPSFLEDSVQEHSPQ